jgi:hypothetical protein
MRDDEGLKVVRALLDLEVVVRKGLLAEGDNSHTCIDPACLLCEVRRKVDAIDKARASA